MQKHRQRFIEALGLQLAVIAGIHLLLVIVLAIYRKDLHYINPLYFFGLSEITSSHIHSGKTIIAGWVFLVVCFFIFAYLLRNVRIMFVDKPIQKTTNNDEF